MIQASLTEKQSENGASIVLVSISIKILLSDLVNLNYLVAFVEVQNGTPLTGTTLFITRWPFSISNLTLE